MKYIVTVIAHYNYVMDVEVELPDTPDDQIEEELIKKIMASGECLISIEDTQGNGIEMEPTHVEIDTYEVDESLDEAE